MCQTMTMGYLRLSHAARELPAYEEQLRCLESALGNNSLVINGREVNF